MSFVFMLMMLLGIKGNAFGHQNPNNPHYVACPTPKPDTCEYIWPQPKPPRD